MIDPRLSKPRIGVRIGVKDCVVLDDQLAGAQMPPHIGISHAARRHSEKAQYQDDHKHAAGLEKLLHPCKDTLRLCNPNACLVARTILSGSGKAFEGVIESSSVPSASATTAKTAWPGQLAYNASLTSMLKESTQRKLTLYLAPMLFFHVFLAWNARRGVRMGLADFTIFYTAGEILHQGRGAELYDNTLQETVQRSFSPIGLQKRGAILQYNHPPFEALLFVPFVRMTYLTAYVVWLGVNLGLTVALLLLLRKNFVILGSAPVYLWLLAGFGFFPLFKALLQGQDSILLLWCYSVGFLAFRRRNESRAGNWIGLGLFKFHLVLPFVLPLVLLRRQRFLTGFFSVGFVLVLLGFAAVGWRGWLSYPFYVWAGENNLSYVWNSSLGETSNLKSLIASLCPAGEPRLTLFLVLLFSAILLAGVTYAWRRALLATAVYTELVFALGLVATVLLSYHIFVHDLSLLFLAALIVLEVLLSSRVMRSWARTVVYGCIGILFCTPIYVALSLRYRLMQVMAGVILIFFVVLLIEFVRVQSGADAADAL